MDIYEDAKDIADGRENYWVYSQRTLCSYETILAIDEFCNLVRQENNNLNRSLSKKKVKNEDLGQDAQCYE